MNFGKSFKFYRQKANLSQKEAAEMIGVKAYQLGNYETNRSQPSLEVLIKMSKVYLTSIDKMLGNNMLHNKYEKEHQSDKKDYVDINEIVKQLNEYVEQISKDNEE